MKPSLIPRFNLDYNFKDFCYSIKSIFSNSGYDLDFLKSMFGKETFLFTNSGRSSLFVILRALNLPKGSKVGVPLYSCTVVFDAIIKAGYVPCFIDIDTDNYTMDPEDLEEKIEDLSAVVVIHTFGRPADMDKIKKIADDKAVVEDCAHSLLSEYKGRKTGTLGNASFFSLAKYISAGTGGMIILNDDEIMERSEKEIDRLNNSSILNEIKHCLKVYARSFSYRKPWFGLFALPVGSFIENKLDLMNKRGFNVERIKKSDLKLILKKIYSFKNKVEKQRKNSFFLIDELGGTSLKLPYESKNVYCNYYLFPIIFRNKEERNFTSDFLRNEGIDTAKLYSRTPSKAKQYYGYTGDCPNTEKLADTVLTVPNYYSLSDKELLKVANCIKRVEKLL